VRVKISRITQAHIGKPVKINGWVRSVRDQKSFSFIMVNDGSNIAGIEVVAQDSMQDYAQVIASLTNGCSVAVAGTVVASQGKEQAFEIQAESIVIIGGCDPEEYLLQKKRHSFEFLRTIAHLRPRTNTFGAVARVRNALAYATHKFFQERDFLYLNAPIITQSDCEGAGEMFQVTTLDLKNVPKNDKNQVDFTKDFFEKPTFLTVSGQLNGETYACALSDIYTFGPTFRAENSNTSRHLAEFWMIEPEMAFADLTDDMAYAESYLKYCLSYVLENCAEDMKFFDGFIKKGIIQQLQQVIQEPFARISYTQAVEILQKSGAQFEYPVVWGGDLQTEHERYLAETYCKKPVIVFNYPTDIKAFYFRRNDDGKTVAAMDVLVPAIGEIIGGGQREDRHDMLKERIESMGLNAQDYWWYLELRKYGSVPHAGFGLGFERLVQFTTGMENIRDVIPFPRYPKHIDF